MNPVWTYKTMQGELEVKHRAQDRVARDYSRNSELDETIDEMVDKEARELTRPIHGVPKPP